MKKKLFLQAAAAAMLAAGLCPAAPGAEPQCRVASMVCDAAGKPIAGAVVTLQRSGESRIHEARSGADGAFSLPVACGVYRVTVRKEGFYGKLDVWKLDAGMARQGRIEMAALQLQPLGEMRSLPPELAQEMQAALAAMKKGEYRAALPVLKKVAERYPRDADILYMIGVAQNKSGAATEALVALNRSLEIRPDFAGARYELGLAYHNLNQWQPAQENYEKALRLAPDRAEIHFNLGLLLFNMGRPREALEHFSSTLKATPDDAAALEMAARCQLQMGVYPPALEYLQKVRLLTKDPEKIKELDGLIFMLQSRIKG